VPGETIAALMQRLPTSQEGLGQAEVDSRRQQYGYNKLPEKAVNPFLKFLSYFWGLIPVMIIIAAALSAVLRHWPDLGVILALLVMNAIVGFREEHQAGNAVAALKKQLAVRATVRWDGRWSNIPARELVPGDIMRLRIGNIIPADARLLFDRQTIQTLTYLKLSVAGHLTVFVTRTRGHFWSIRPAPVLLLAILGTQAVATLIAVYGLGMSAIGWKWAGLVWAYALAWLLVNDQVKLLAYRVFAREPSGLLVKSSGSRT
jgi:magnesium-transporting ATPase (P-type)